MDGKIRWLARDPDKEPEYFNLTPEDIYRMDPNTRLHYCRWACQYFGLRRSHKKWIQKICDRYFTDIDVFLKWSLNQKTGGK